MKRKHWILAVVWMAAFVLWTAAVQNLDVQAIGPGETSVGFAALNRWMHDFTGVHMALYTITDWLSLAPAAMVMGFGLLGLMQWIRRRHICKVDRDILALGGFYLLVLAAYMVFELYVVNYRPVLIDGRLEASYPSSTTMLVLCVMITARMQLRMRMAKPQLRRCIIGVMDVFTAFMVLGRLVSGVHWFSDIIGGILLSAALIELYNIARQ